MNPFRDRMMARVYDAMMEAYDTRHKDLFWPGGHRSRGNGFADAFWRGYDSAAVPVSAVRPAWDARSKRTPAYACWQAGRTIAKRGD